MSASEKGERARRKHLIYFVKITSPSGESFTGRLVNISSEGLKVVTKGKFFLGDTYSLEISLPEEIDKLNHVACTAKTVWCRQKRGSDNLSAGFEIVEMNETNKALLRELMKDFI